MSNLFAQNDLESFLNPVSESSVVINTFKSTRIINNHSVEIFDTNQFPKNILTPIFCTRNFYFSKSLSDFARAHFCL